MPLDYTDPSSNATMDLQIVKVNATKQPSRGSILFNPGGPGAPGRDFITDAAGSGSSLLLMTGGEYDLVSFDPRGTGETLPFNCYASTADRLAALYITPATLSQSDVALGNAFAAREVLAELCLETQRTHGELIGTIFVARDMMRIVDALDEDGLLRYWG